MTFKDYQQKAHEFAVYNFPLVGGMCIPWTYPVMGLTEEAGEVAGKFAKAIRDDNGRITEERKTEIVKELGDVAWMLAEICSSLDIEFEDIFVKNIEKLESRLKRGKINGSGDNR